MKTKITLHNFNIDMFKGLLLIALLFSYFKGFAQTAEVTSVSPTTVTYKTTITIKGQGFTNNDLLSIRLGAPSSAEGLVPIINRTLSPDNSEMSFDIDSITPSSGVNFSRTIYINSINTGVEIDYIAPKYRVLKNDYGASPKVPVDARIQKITEIFTSFKGFWRSSEWNDNKIDVNRPNTSHDLLGFTYDGDIYSTGVNDDLLASNLKADELSSLKRQKFKAYSTNGISGKTHSENYLIMGDSIDGAPGSTVLSNEIRNKSIYSVIIDGENGLDLGTGITNFNQKANVRFYSGNGKVGAVDDEAPDLLITQIADPGNPDVYYYADGFGNVLGRPIHLTIANEKGHGSAKLADWNVDLFSMTNANFDLAVPLRAVNVGSRIRGLRMVAFKLSEFGITLGNIEDVKNINMMAGGTADIAFLAYNTAAFDIKSPVVTTAPVSQFICRLPSNSVIKFKAEASLEGGPADPSDEVNETFEYKWFKNNTLIPNESSNEYTLNSPSISVTMDDLTTYRLQISNEYGAVILPVTLAEGGTPVNWNGSNFVLPPAYINAGLGVKPENRNLIFSPEIPYNVDDDLEGCDCLVPAGSTVTIRSGRTLKLYNNITVEGKRDIVENGVKIGELLAGTFTLENNASLIQTKEVSSNDNLGIINVKREAQGLKKYDYVYWSSPVEIGNMSMIPGATQHVYQWDVNTENSNSTKGNWGTIPGGVMEKGKGYIKRVNGELTIPSVFDGKPNNGLIKVDVFKTELSGSEGMDDAERHSNLLGNPYPSALSAESFLKENINLEGFVKIWSHTKDIFDPTNVGDEFYEGFKYTYGDQYLTYNKTGPIPPPINSFDGNIASGQGFFVKLLDAASETEEVTFNNKMRYDAANPNGYNNDDFKRGVSSNGTADLNEKQLIYLSLVNEKNMSSIALVGYAEGATNGKDRLYDASSAPGDMRIYSLIDNDAFLIQGRSLPFDDNDRVQLGVEVLKNGIYKIGIDQLKGNLMVNPDQGIYLEDTYKNVIHDLRKSPYGFTAETGNIKDRFVLRYTNQTLSVDQPAVSETFVYVQNDRLFVRAAKFIESVVVYDLTGKKLVDYKLDQATDRFDAAFEFPKGAYLTSIGTKDGSRVTKKVMN